MVSVHDMTKNAEVRNALLNITNRLDSLEAFAKKMPESAEKQMINLVVNDVREDLNALEGHILDY